MLHAKHSSIIFFFTMWHVGSSFPDQGLNRQPLHWEGGVLTTGPGTVLDTSVIKTVRSPALGELVLSWEKIHNKCEKSVNPADCEKVTIAMAKRKRTGSGIRNLGLGAWCRINWGGLGRSHWAGEIWAKTWREREEAKWVSRKAHSRPVVLSLWWFLPRTQETFCQHLETFLLSQLCVCLGAARIYKGEATNIPQYTQDNFHDKELARWPMVPRWRSWSGSGKSQRKGSVAEACVASTELLWTHMAGGRRQEPRWEAGVPADIGQGRKWWLTWVITAGFEVEDRCHLTEHFRVSVRLPCWEQAVGWKASDLRAGLDFPLFPPHPLPPPSLPAASEQKQQLWDVPPTPLPAPVLSFPGTGHRPSPRPGLRIPLQSIPSVRRRTPVSPVWERRCPTSPRGRAVLQRSWVWEGVPSSSASRG